MSEIKIESLLNSLIERVERLEGRSSVPWNEEPPLFEKYPLPWRIQSIKESRDCRLFDANNVEILASGRMIWIDVIDRLNRSIEDE